MRTGNIEIPEAVVTENASPLPSLKNGIVTTTGRPTPEMIGLAQSMALQLDVDYVPYRVSIKRAREESKADYAVVLEKDDLKLAWKEGVFRHHPGLSIYRVGIDQPSQFIGATRPGWGEKTLDLTLGFARDATVIADRTENEVVKLLERKIEEQISEIIAIRRISNLYARESQRNYRHNII